MTKKEVFGLIFFLGLMAYGIFGCDQPGIEKFDSNLSLEYRSDTATIGENCDTIPCEHDLDPVPFQQIILTNATCCEWKNNECKWNFTYMPYYDVNVPYHGQPVKFTVEIFFYSTCQDGEETKVTKTCCDATHLLSKIPRDSLFDNGYWYLFDIVGCCPNVYTNYCCDPVCDPLWWICRQNQLENCCTEVQVSIYVKYEDDYEEQMLCEWQANPIWCD